MQFTHSLAPALTLDMVPGWQRRHTDAPSAGLYVPGPHARHDVDRAGENVPASHALHWDASTLDENVPSAQAVHVLAPSSWL